jgi:hypothetical protein
MKYYFIKRESVNYIFKEENNITISIPYNIDNSDYQAYLKWVAEGNTAEELND